MRFACALIRSARAVPLEHLSGSPSCEAHEIAFGSAVREPLVGEGMAELMRADLAEPGLLAPSAQHLRDAAVGHSRVPADAEPERGKVGVQVLRASA